MKRCLALVLMLCLVVSCGGGDTSVPEAAETLNHPPAQVPTSVPSVIPTPECGGEQLTAFLDGFSDLMTRWDDATSRANNTPRISLSPVIGELQEIKREVGSLDGQSCTEEAQELMVAYMEQVVKAFNLFMSGKYTDGQISQQFKIAEDLLDDAVPELDALRMKVGDGG